MTGIAFSRRSIVALAGTLLAGSIAGPALAGLGLAFHADSTNGLYVIVASPADTPAPALGPIHAWILEVKNASGEPVTGATIAVDGGMAAHGHGLPTAPQVVAENPPGTYRIDGVKFSMMGEWQMRFTIDSPAGKDTAEISFNVK